jgi:glycosyltransferase involved in cell wall biosynthesis
MFAFVANVQLTKNVDCLLDALLLAQEAGHAIRVDWIGRDELGLVSQWQAKHERLSNFTVKGSVSEADLMDTYRNAVALVVPSLKEGFCLPVLEAHAFGTPVIAADISTLQEVVGEGGVFFDPTDPQQLLHQMLALAADDEVRCELSAKARLNGAKYSWAKAATELLAFVQQSSQERRNWRGLVAILTSRANRSA